MTFYFAVKDGTVNAETGEKDDAGMAVKTMDDCSVEAVIQMLECKLPFYKGRIRPITKEEYEQDYGEDEQE